ncbi:MAG: hypothetical protein ACC662_07560, partial [Planctomycetota bacterium]
MTESIEFLSGPFTLSARLHRPAHAVGGAALVTHPHAAHGGTMDHPVVARAAERAAHAGLFALRFDFRGAGGSEGEVTDREGHRADVGAAARLLRA